MMVPYCFSNPGVLDNQLTVNLVHLEQTEKLEGSEGWFSFLGKLKL